MRESSFSGSDRFLLVLMQCVIFFALQRCQESTLAQKMSAGLSSFLRAVSRAGFSISQFFDVDEINMNLHPSRKTPDTRASPVC